MRLLSKDCQILIRHDNQEKRTKIYIAGGYRARSVSWKYIVKRGESDTG